MNPCSRKRKNVRVAALLAVVALLGAPASASATDAIELDAVLSMTGSGAFLGSQVAQSLAVLEKSVNAAGGIAGRPIKFVIADDASVPANAVQLVNGIAAKHAAVVIGPVIVGTCAAVLPLLTTGPLTYCLATPVQAPSGSNMFTQGANASGYPAKALRYFHTRGVRKIALITATDASGQAYERDFNDAMATPDWRGFELVDREHFANGDLSLAAQVSRIKAAAPDAILSFSVGPSFGMLVRSLSDAGVNVPLVSSAANLNPAQLEPLRAIAPTELLFCANAGIVPVPNAKGAWKAATTRFDTAFADAGVHPTVLSTIAWDASLLVLAGLQKLGPAATAAQLRDFVVHTHGWTGIYGTYDFNAYPQRGLGPDSIFIYRWDAAKNQLLTLDHS